MGTYESHGRNCGNPIFKHFSVNVANQSSDPNIDAFTSRIIKLLLYFLTIIARMYPVSYM